MIRNRHFAFDHIFIPTSNWSFQDLLKRFRSAQSATTFDELVSRRCEEVLRQRLSRLVPISPKRVIRFGEGGRIRYREMDSICFDDAGLILYEFKLTTRRGYAAKGMEQLRSAARILRRAGYTGQIRLRLVVVADAASVTDGIAPAADLADKSLREAVVRIPTSQLEEYARQERINLPPCWSHPETRFKSRLPDFRVPPVRRTASALLLAALTIGGCTRQGCPITANLFLDGSDRTRAQLLRELNAGYQCNESLTAEDRLNVFVYGHGCELIYRGKRLSTRRDFNAAITSKLLDARDPLWKPGTESQVLLESTARQIDDQPTASVLIGDGGFEDHSPRALNQISAAVRDLAANPKASTLLMLGVASVDRQAWERTLAPLGCSRFAVRGFLDADDGIRLGFESVRGGRK